MGNIVSSATPAPTSLTNYVSELPEFTYEKRFDSFITWLFRLMISVWRVQDSSKRSFVVERETFTSSRSSSNHLPTSPYRIISVNYKVISSKFSKSGLNHPAERDLLFDIPNTLTYNQVLETEQAGYLIRQSVYSNLYDRIRFVLGVEEDIDYVSVPDRL